MQQQLVREGMRNESTEPKEKVAKGWEGKKLVLKLEKNLEIRKQLEATLIYFKIEIKQVLVQAEHHKNCHAKGKRNGWQERYGGLRVR